MKKKRKTPPINMTHCDPVLDRDGHSDCLRGLSDALYELFRRRKIPRKRRRILVLVSIVYGRADFPMRGTIEKAYTFGYLCRVYKEWTKTDFDPIAYKESKNWDLENSKKQGEKTMAWAGYAQYLYIKKIISQEEVIQSLPKDEQAEQRKQFEKENGSDMIRIG